MTRSVPDDALSCVSYGLHERLKVNLPESQARNLRDSPNVQGKVITVRPRLIFDPRLECDPKWMYSRYQYPSSTETSL